MENRHFFGEMSSLKSTLWWYWLFWIHCIPLGYKKLSSFIPFSNVRTIIVFIAESSQEFWVWSKCYLCQHMLPHMDACFMSRLSPQRRQTFFCPVCRALTAHARGLWGAATHLSSSPLLCCHCQQTRMSLIACHSFPVPPQQEPGQTQLLWKYSNYFLLWR